MFIIFRNIFLRLISYLDTISIYSEQSRNKTNEGLQKKVFEFKFVRSIDRSQGMSNENLFNRKTYILIAYVVNFYENPRYMLPYSAGCIF